MNDTAIKNYAIWARRELIAEVGKRCTRFGILEKGSPEAAADAIDGHVLSAAEKRQRADLLRVLKADGYEALVERAAYTWFNRLLAIRFMELNDRLPSHVRVLSAPDGSFRPQALVEAMDLPLEALDRDCVVQLVQAGDDEALFRLVFLAQCDELAQCMPAVFERVGSAMELLLPDGLMRTGGVVEQLVTAIPEDDWREGVEIVGWMYQYYVSERKDEVFASFKKGKKAEREAIAPATQLFTPNWIVRYLTENSLGRLWMLNNPDSGLTESMPYFVKPDEHAETEFKRVANPEEITVVDPACGSGHIMVYAFDLLAAMYAEAGYSNRDAARLILEKNLSGMEIDPRAAAMASFCLTMKACELDGRFLRRGVSPRVTVLGRVEFEGEELSLCPGLRANKALLDAATHLDECGSLLQVTESDLASVARDLASLSGRESLFAASAAGKLARLQKELEPLAERYDVVVANPPYMGSSNMNKWIAEWMKDAYPDSKRDLCTCFIERGGKFVGRHGYVSMITASSWMFISSFEEFRKKLLRSASITSMIQQSTHGYAGVTVPTTMFVLADGAQGAVGSYVRLEDFDRPQWQEPRALEALANPDCGWFYRRSADAFGKVPGSPIVYWAAEPVFRAFAEEENLGADIDARVGLITGDGNRFLRRWHEIAHNKISFENKPGTAETLKWVPYTKGGEYRLWYGNLEHVVNWDSDGWEMKNDNFDGDRPRAHNFNGTQSYKEGITWNSISSSRFHCRYLPEGFLFDAAGPLCEVINPENLKLVLGLFSSSTFVYYMRLMNPTMNFPPGYLEAVPFMRSDSSDEGRIIEAVNENIDLSRADWDAFEESWNFKKHPLV